MTKMARVVFLTRRTNGRKMAVLRTLKVLSWALCFIRLDSLLA